MSLLVLKQTKGDNKMRTYLYCEAGFVEKAQWLPNSWVNVVCPNNDDFEFLTKTLNVPESFLDDIADTDERPRTDTEGNWLLTILRIPVVNKQNGSLPSTLYRLELSLITRLSCPSVITTRIYYRIS